MQPCRDKLFIERNGITVNYKRRINIRGKVSACDRARASTENRSIRVSSPFKADARVADIDGSLKKCYFENCIRKASIACTNRASPVRANGTARVKIRRDKIKALN